MPITTKTGDDGKTSLFYGGRVKKDSLRIEVCGILDELSSSLGLAKSLLRKKEKKNVINKIQADLLLIGSEIVCGRGYVGKLRKSIRQQDIRRLELSIKKLEKKHSRKKQDFILPGKNTVSATLDVARTIARKAERRVVTLRNKRMVKNKSVLVYLNRLSDLLYLLARSYEG